MALELSSVHLVCVALFGLIVGSFLNVVIYRLPREESVVFPASHCPHCENKISWYHNLPLLGWLILRGKCAHCAQRISAQYPLVELLTAVLFLVSWRGFDSDLSWIMAQVRIWVLISICIATFFIDLKHRIIPDELSVGGAVFGALTAYWDFRHGMGGLLLAGVLGFGFFFLFAVLYEKVTGRVGLGGGDIKFMATVGVFLGIGGLWTTLLLSSVLGSVVGVIYGSIQKRKHGSDESLLRASIPYGPFLVMGALVELFFEVSRWMIA